MAENNMDLLAWLRKQLAEAEPDLLREMVRTFAESLMGAEADALCGAGFRERTGERVNRRNGYREILGLDTFTSEDEAAWRVFLTGLVERGLSGVQLVVSDDQRGLTKAIDALLPGAGWQRCRVHAMRNLLAAAALAHLNTAAATAPETTVPEPQCRHPIQCVVCTR